MTKTRSFQGFILATSFLAAAAAALSTTLTAQTSIGPFRLLRDIGPGATSPRGGSSPSGFTRFGDRVVFQAYSVNLGIEPWITDGTTAGTVLLGDLTPGAAVGGHKFTVVGDELWIASRDVTSRIHRSDGTPGSATLVATIPNAGGLIGEFVAFRDGALVEYNDGSSWSVDFVDPAGTRTTLLTSALYAAPVYVAIDRAYLIERTPSGSRYWITDGTLRGTTRVATGTDVRAAALFRDRLWVVSASGQVSYLDSRLVETRFPALDGQPVGQMLAADGKLYVLRTNTLQATDGTPAGTTTIALPSRIAPLSGETFGHRVLFVTDDNSVRISDGTAAGTQVLSQRLLSINRLSVAEVGPDRAYFSATGSTTFRNSVFVTDGTASGTQVVTIASVAPNLATIGLTVVIPPALTAINGLLYARIVGSQVGNEPYVLDLDSAVETSGTPCSATAFRTLPLRVDAAPRIGAAVRIRAVATGATSGGIVLGSPAPLPLQIAPGLGCSLLVDPASAVFLGPMAVTPDGSFGVNVQIPAAPALVRLQLLAQAVSGPSSSAIGVESSPGLFLQIGQ